MPNRIIPDPHLKHICRIGQGAFTCSFIGLEDGKFMCQKGTPEEKFIRTQRELGKMNALGNNCSGPPDFIPNK